MKTYLVSLVGGQTLPNVQLIQEFASDVDGYIFIETAKEKRKTDYTLNAAYLHGLPKEQILRIEVDAFSFQDIETKLGEHISEEHRYIVNATGGTKPMSFACIQFFERMQSHIYYITGQGGEYVQIHPSKPNSSKKRLFLSKSINLEQHLMSMGYSIAKKSTCFGSKELAERVFSYVYAQHDDLATWSELLAYRSKTCKLEDIPAFAAALEQIGYQPKQQGKLDKYESRYFTGDWLEEYVYYKIQEHLQLPEECIGLGYQLQQGEQALPNELDVLFLKDEKLSIVECKTSVFVATEPGKQKSLLNDFTYKAFSINKNLGLFAKSKTYTISDLSDARFKQSKERSKAYNVGLISREEIEAGKDLELLLR